MKNYILFKDWTEPETGEQLRLEVRPASTAHWLGATEIDYLVDPEMKELTIGTLLSSDSETTGKTTLPKLPLGLASSPFKKISLQLRENAFSENDELLLDEINNNDLPTTDDNIVSIRINPVWTLYSLTHERILFQGVQKPVPSRKRTYVDGGVDIEIELTHIRVVLEQIKTTMLHYELLQGRRAGVDNAVTYTFDLDEAVYDILYLDSGRLYAKGQRRKIEAGEAKEIAKTMYYRDLFRALEYKADQLYKMFTRNENAVLRFRSYDAFHDSYLGGEGCPITHWKFYEQDLTKNNGIGALLNNDLIRFIAGVYRNDDATNYIGGFVSYNSAQEDSFSKYGNGWDFLDNIADNFGCKTSFRFDSTFGIDVFNLYLDFLPPLMTAIDVSERPELDAIQYAEGDEIGLNVIQYAEAAIHQKEDNVTKVRIEKAYTNASEGVSLQFPFTQSPDIRSETNKYMGTAMIGGQNTTAFWQGTGSPSLGWPFVNYFQSGFNTHGLYYNGAAILTTNPSPGAVPVAVHHYCEVFDGENWHESRAADTLLMPVLPAGIYAHPADSAHYEIDINGEAVKTWIDQIRANMKRIGNESGVQNAVLKMAMDLFSRSNQIVIANYQADNNEVTQNDIGEAYNVIIKDPETLAESTKKMYVTEVEPEEITGISKIILFGLG